MMLHICFIESVAVVIVVVCAVSGHATSAPFRIARSVVARACHRNLLCAYYVMVFAPTAHLGDKKKAMLRIITKF